MKIYMFWMVCALAVIVAGCSKSNDDTLAAPTDDCYISSFVLGQMRQARTMKSSTGSDSTYNVSFSGSYYPFVIDQRASTITMAKPLPMGTFVNAVLTTLTFQGAVVHAPAADTTSWTAYDSKDSVDFTSPRIYRVYSTDGRSHRDYTVSLDIRSNNADEYTWTLSSEAMPEMEDVEFTWTPSAIISSDYNILASLAYAQSNGNRRVLLACRKNGSDATEPLAIWSLLVDNNEDWTLFNLSPDNPYGLVVQTTPHLVAYEDDVLAFTEGSRRIYVSKDNGVTWKRNDKLYIPADAEVAAADGTPLPMSVVAADDAVWLSIGDVVWQMRRNGHGE